MKLNLVVRLEAGHDLAIEGLSYNKKQTNTIKMEKVARKLAKQDGGHNKFLESIAVWIELSAPRYFWQEFDTYRVGMTKQSESTMHTLTKDDLNLPMAFEDNVSLVIINIIKTMVQHHNSLQATVKNLEQQLSINPTAVCKEDLEIKRSQIDQIFLDIKANLPEGFIQKRMIFTNYKTLRTIYYQRRRHRLPHWQTLASALLNQLECPHYIDEQFDLLI